MKKEEHALNIKIDFQPVQAELYDVYEFGTATRIGLGGSRGGTKSHTADSVMLMRRYKYPGTSGLFIMKVYQDMFDIHINPMFEQYPGLEQHFNKQFMILKLPNSGGSFVRFLSGDTLMEFRKRKGRGFADVMVDQSELFTQDEIEFLYTINRSVHKDITPKTLLCFNPGNIGHTYNKRVFYDKIYQENEDPKDFGFVQTFGWDNAYWCQKSLNAEGKSLDDFHKMSGEDRFQYFITKSEYGKNLNQLPDSKRKAELLGDMDIFEGMFFSDFRRKHHVIENYERKKEFNSVAGLDYGNTTVLEVLQCDYEGTVVTCGEVYLADFETPAERANAIADYLLSNELYKLEIIYDTDMEISQISNVGYDKTPIAIFREVFKQRMGDKAPSMVLVNKTSLDKKKGYRAVVNEAVKEYLHINQDKSKIYFSSECKFLIRELTEMIYDPLNPDGMDFLNTGPNKPHAYDAFKYALMSIYQPRKPKEDTRPIWRKKLDKKRELKKKSIMAK